MWEVLGEVVGGVGDVWSSYLDLETSENASEVAAGSFSLQRTLSENKMLTTIVSMVLLVGAVLGGVYLWRRK